MNRTVGRGGYHHAVPDRGAGKGVRPLRSDAERNRARVLAAARASVAEHGLDVGVDEIARRAGVGIGTLYRRFPTKHALVSALVLDALTELVDAARMLLAEAQPADGFERFLRHMIGVRAANGVSMSLLWSADTDEAARSELTPLVTRLLENAQRAGTVRADITYEDVPMLVWSVGAVIDATAGIADEVWKRLLDVIVDGLRPGREGLSRPPMTEAQLEAATAQRRAQLRTRNPPEPNTG